MPNIWNGSDKLDPFPGLAAQVNQRVCSAPLGDGEQFWEDQKMRLKEKEGYFRIRAQNTRTLHWLRMLHVYCV